MDRESVSKFFTTIEWTAIHIERIARQHNIDTPEVVKLAALVVKMSLDGLFDKVESCSFTAINDDTLEVNVRGINIKMYFTRFNILFIAGDKVLYIYENIW